MSAISKSVYVFCAGVILTSVIAGCGSKEMAAVETVATGEYQIELRSQEGILKSGNNDIEVVITREGSVVDIQDVDLMFFMPQMGSMPYMEMHAEFAERAEGESAAGNLEFNMGGSWTSRLRVVTPEGPVEATFTTHVEERQ